MVFRYENDWMFLYLVSQNYKSVMIIVIMIMTIIILIVISSFSCDNLYLAKLTGKNKNLGVENIIVVIFDTC